MSSVALVLALLAATFQMNYAQLVQGGRCPELEVKQHFDLKQYLGTWYQRATFGTALFQGVGRCVTAVYALNSSSASVDVFNKQIPVSSGFSAMSSIRGSAVLQDPDRMEGKLLVTFPIPVLGSITSPYWVLDTDYNSWALVYSCVDLRLAHITSGWILTRVQELDDEAARSVETQVASALARAGLSRAMFTDTDQKNCHAVEKLSRAS